MVNLLFISCSSRIDGIKSALQPFLKARIDSVADFDYGLKEVFEKRPSIVFIQEQIAGVTGESVARHIQMLLGLSSPDFILLHDGTHKAKPIKGLYNYMIDLSLSDSLVVDEIRSTLKSLLGKEWQKIFNPPEEDYFAVTPRQTVSDSKPEIANEPVANVISTPEYTKQVFDANDPFEDFVASDVSLENPFVGMLSTTQGQLDEIVAGSPDEITHNEPEAAIASEKLSGKETSVSGAELNLDSRPSPPPDLPARQKTDATDRIAASIAAVPAPAAPTAQKQPVSGAVAVKGTGVVTPSLKPVTPANFRISRESSPSETVTKERDCNVAVAQYSRDGDWRKLVLAIILLVLASGGAYWYFIQKNSKLPSLPKRNDAQSTIEKAKVSAQDVSKSPSLIQNPVEPALPSFIPVAGLDPTYSSKNPGWERYVGSEYEFRLYREGRRLNALQVLASKTGAITDASLKSMLSELTGNGDYKITSQESKSGLLKIRATINGKTDVLIYRNKTSVRAFVVSFK